eukprot:1353304-Alexandrium_andersonii.AAC.1
MKGKDNGMEGWATGMAGKDTGTKGKHAANAKGKTGEDAGVKGKDTASSTTSPTNKRMRYSRPAVAVEDIGSGASLTYL